MEKYEHGKIYRIVNEVTNDIYIGSTCNPLCLRMALHRYHARTGNTSKVYQVMTEIGIEHFKIQLLEEFPCDSRKELQEREEQFINMLRPTLNQRSANATPERRKQQRQESYQRHKDDKRQYYIRNRERIKAYTLRRYYANKQNID